MRCTSTDAPGREVAQCPPRSFFALKKRTSLAFSRQYLSSRASHAEGLPSASERRIWGQRNERRPETTREGFILPAASLDDSCPRRPEILQSLRLLLDDNAWCKVAHGASPMHRVGASETHTTGPLRVPPSRSSRTSRFNSPTSASKLHFRFSAGMFARSCSMNSSAFTTRTFLSSKSIVFFTSSRLLLQARTVTNV